MPYTLIAGLAWFAVAFAIGVVMGVLVRSVAARRQLVRARASERDLVELARLRRRVAELEGAPGTTPTTGSDDTTGTAPTTPAADAVTADPAVLPDATRALGRTVVLDDLTVVEGLGPGVEDLCHGIGIRTWSDLAETEVSLLRTMLDDAGPRYRVHDPATWPEQARLLAAGRWDDFRALVESATDRPIS